MYLHEILADIRLALAVGIFCAGGAFGVIWCAAFYLIDKASKNKREGKRK